MDEAQLSEMQLIEKTSKITGLEYATVLDLYDNGWAFVQKLGQPDMWRRQTFTELNRKENQ